MLWLGTAAGYSAGLVLFGNEAGFWHMSATKATVYWFFGTAVDLVGSATKLSPATQPSSGNHRGVRSS